VLVSLPPHKYEHLHVIADCRKLEVKFAVASNDIMSTFNFVEIGQLIQELKGTHTHAGW
jgi:hypothetical protein